MKKIIPFLFLAVWIVIIFLAACEENSVTEPEMGVDTVYVAYQHWVGWHYTFADSDPLNSQVTDHIRAGWDCTEVLQFPFWVRLIYDDDAQTVYSNEIALVVLHAFVCLAPDAYATSEPMTAPILRDLIGPHIVLPGGAP